MNRPSRSHEVFFLALLVGANAAAACPSEYGDINVSQLSAETTSINFSSGNQSNSIASFGVIRNNSPLCADDIVLEIKYFDSKGVQVDVATQSLFGVTIAPGQESAFRIRDEADKPRELYATSSVRIISVEPKFGRAAPSGTWSGILVSWVPMLLLIVVWFIFMARILGKNSPQRRTLALVERQTASLARQQETLERIAMALEK